MSQSIRFQQHIRTSSKVRRGFRTYQRAAGMDQATDEKLGSYGVYNPTVYADLAAMRLEDYPELFMFYVLDNKKVVCRSVYIGLDRHSYPARAGNYISHALIYEGNTAFNPVEIYQKARWKTRDDIAAEDIEGAFITDDIDALTVITEQDFLETSWFDNLIVPGRYATTAEAHDRALATRQQMFRQAVDAILQRKKIIIIDDKSRLLPWTMTLLQVFPAEFVSKYLTIASFANTGLLLDVCDVLCFEKENAEKAVRYNNKVTLIDFDGSLAQQSSTYSQVLLKAITTRSFDEFRKQVFPKIISSYGYGMAEFNKAAEFYDKLGQIAGMTVDEFKSFMPRFVNDQEYIRAIFEEVKKEQHAGKCAVIWRELEKIKLITAQDISQYRYIAGFVFSPGTDELWVEFECELAGKLVFTTVSEVDNFYKVTHITNKKREAYCFERIMSIIGNSTVPEMLAEGLKCIHNEIREMNAAQQQQYATVEQYMNVLEKVKHEDVTARYKSIRDAAPRLNEQQLSKLVSLVPVIIWKDFFGFLEEHSGLLKSLYEIKAMEIKLPPKELGRMILTKEYETPGHINRFYELFSSLNNIDRIAFYQNATREVQEAIILKIPVETIEKVEEVCRHFEKVRIEKVIERLVMYCEQRASYNELWKLCDIVHNQHENKSTYPAVLARMNTYDLRTIYTMLENDRVTIPAIYERLAVSLHNKGLIKRHVPRNEMFFDIAELRAIGDYQHIERVKQVLAKRSLDLNILYNLIKLPWPWFAWKILFDQLNESDRKKIPEILDALLNHIKAIHKDADSKPSDTSFSLRQWLCIICHYHVFLILENRKEHFFRLVEKLPLSQGEYKYIANTLLVLTNKRNELYDIFLSPDRSWYSPLIKGKGPTWDDYK